MAGYIKSDIVILYKNSPRSNAKLRMKVLADCTADYVIDKISAPRYNGFVGIPKNAKIVKIGVGTSFIKKWKTYYNL